jgi:RHS repeat-associated protein
VPNPWGFAGGYLDTTGLYHFGDRYYDPSVGRWTQQDPMAGSITNPSTLNRYAYANADPVNFSDPTGMWSWGAFLVATFGTAFLAAVGGCITGAVATIWSTVGAFAGCGIGAISGAAGGLFLGAGAYSFAQLGWGL